MHKFVIKSAKKSRDESALIIHDSIFDDFDLISFGLGVHCEFQSVINNA